MSYRPVDRFKTRLTVLMLVFLLICVSIAASEAAGRVYGTTHSALCSQIAKLKGVYAVYGMPDDEDDNAVPIQVVIVPGARGEHVAKEIEDDLIRTKTPVKASPAGFEIYTYHDPLQNHDFTRTMSNLFPGITGFPDYRGVEVATVPKPS